MALNKVTYTDLVTVIWAQNLNDIQDAIIALEEWQSEAGADIPQILADIAPKFSNSTSYSAGDCVIVLNKLYQFTAAHPAGNWTGTDATEVNVTSLLKEAVASLSGDVDDLKSDLGEITTEVKSNNLFDINSSDTLIGKYRNATDTVVDNANFMCTNLIDVTDISIVYCKQFKYGTDVTFLQVLKYDADGNFIERSAINSSVSGRHDYTVGNEKYVRFNVQYPNGADVAEIAKTFMLASYNITYFEEYFDPYLTVDSVAISRIDSTHFQINFGNASVILFYTDNSASGNANWNIGTLKIGNAVLVPGGTDILGPVKINSDTDFIGGVHGDETTTCIYISIGGKTLIPAQIVNPVVSDTLVITMASEVYEQGTTTKAFDRVVQIAIRKGKMLISNTFTAAESLTLKRATNGGTLACYSDDIVGIAFNNSYYPSVPTASVSNAAGTNTMATIHTKYGSATVRNIIGNASSNYTGYLQVFTSETPQRCKIYFDTYKAGDYSLSQYGKVTGTFEYIFA